MSEQRWFRMQHGPAIQWESAEIIYAAYSKLHGTQQSLERLHERGGFGWREVQVIFEELKKRHPDLHAKLMRMNREGNWP